jgi:hypothetical protein
MNIPLPVVIGMVVGGVLLMIASPVDFVIVALVVVAVVLIWGGAARNSATS